MKRIFLCVLTIILATACTKEDGNGTGGSQGSDSSLPPMTDPNDVCSAMDDIIFMQYCYDNFDVNKDGKVSRIEANAVKSIEFRYASPYNEIPVPSSLTGIQYFPNITNFYYAAGAAKPTAIDLSNNTQLKSVDVISSSLSSINFTGCT